jgi:hypothetical protein
VHPGFADGCPNRPGCSSHSGAASFSACVFPVFVNVLDFSRNLIRVSMPSVVPRISAREMDDNMSRSMCQCALYFLQSHSMCSWVWYCSPHGHVVPSGMLK